MSAADIARALKGSRTQRGWLVRCPAHNDRSPSLSISDGEAGRILVKCWTGCSFESVRDALARQGLWPARQGLEPRSRRTGEWNGVHRSHSPAHAAPKPDNPTATFKRDLAQRIWRETEPVSHPLARRYFEQERGIRLPEDFERVRFHPACPFGRETAPAVIAPVNDSVDRLRRRHLADPAQHGRSSERSIAWGSGPTKGNASRLIFSKPATRIALAEGVEDALAWWQLTGQPTWAALSAGNMEAIVLPTRHRRVTIVADADQRGLAAAQALGRRLVLDGRKVRILRPPEGFKDANAALRGNAA